MLIDGFNPILRAGGGVNAGRGEQRRNKTLIAFDAIEKKQFGDTSHELDMRVAGSFFAVFELNP